MIARLATTAAHATVLAFGWRRALIAFVAGVLSALALAPINAWPILFVTLPVLVWLVDGSAAGRWSGAWTAGVAGWCFGFGYFVAGLYWIGYAFLVDAKTFGWLLPVAVSGLPAYLAIFTGLGLAAARLIWVRGPARILALAAATLTMAEWLRGHVLTGFPWNTFGYALTEPLVLAQSVSLVGIWGLTFIAVAVCACPAVLADDRVDTPRPYRVLIFAGLVLAGLVGYGAVRLLGHPTAYVAGVKLRIMQPNLQQDVKFNYTAKDQVMARYLALSDRATGPQSSGVRDATPSDLAGIGVSVLFGPRTRRAGADSCHAEAGYRINHRRGAPGERPQPVPAPITPFTSSTRMARSTAFATRSTWCRSENICRFKPCLNGSACGSSPSR